jgi:hypothetical protein
MGVKYVKRPRMEDLPAISEDTLVSIGATNLNFEKYDEQEFYYNLNRRLDIVQQQINSMS